MTSLQVALLWHRGLLAPRHLYYDAVGLPALAVGLGLWGHLFKGVVSSQRYLSL